MFGIANKTVVAILAALAASGASYGGYKVLKEQGQYGAGFDSRTHSVRSVIDGDTFWIGNWVKVRLIGIDAPEKGACFFQESKEHLKQLTDGVAITLEKDITAQDRFLRLLRYVKVPSDNPEEDTLFVNYAMVRDGYAFAAAVSPDTKYRDLFATAQRQAKAGERGLWGSCEYQEKQANTLREKSSKPADPACTIKGNISEKGYGRQYFLSGCPNYTRIKVDTRKGEAWFCNEKEAKKAGFTKSESCNNTF